MPAFLTFPSGLGSGGASGDDGKSIKIGTVKTVQVDSATKANVTATISSETDTDRIYDFTFTIPQGDDGYSPTVEIFHQVATWRINEDKAPNAFFESESGNVDEFDLSNLNSVEIISWWTNLEEGGIPLEIKFYKDSKIVKTETIDAVTEKSFKFDTTNYDKMTIDTTGEGYANGQIIYSDDTHETGYFLKFTFKENGVIKSFVTENLKGANGKDGETLLSTKYDFILAANAWDSSNTATIRIPGVTGDNLIDIGYQETITNVQLDSLLKAKLVCTDQAENSITLKAYGEKPLVNIPLTAIIEGSYLDIKTIEQIYGTETQYGKITINKDNELAIAKAVGKFNTVGSSGEVFNDYTNNKALGNWSKASGRNAVAGFDTSKTETSTTKPDNTFDKTKIYLYDGSYYHYDSTSDSWGGGGTNTSQSVEGTNCKAYGQSSHSEGQENGSYGAWSHTEGYDNQVYGREGHAEGYHNRITANAAVAHVEGYGTKANADYAHSEGFGSETNAKYSHAQNLGTIASSESQTALGKYNIADADGKYAVIIGDGTSGSNRHNLMALGWDSKLYLNDGDSDAKVINLMNLGDKYTGKETGYGTISINDSNEIEILRAPVYRSTTYVGSTGGQDYSITRYKFGTDLTPYSYKSVRTGSNAAITFESNENEVAEPGSITAGEGLVVDRRNQTVIGQYNDYESYATSKVPFVIGDGTSDTNRSNLFAVDYLGNIIIKGTSYNLAKISSESGSATSVSYSPTTTSGTEIGKLTVGGTTYTLYSPSGDTKVTNTLNATTRAYLTGTTLATTNTGTQIFDTDVYIGSTAGSLYATNFYGTFNGTATSSNVSSKLTVAENKTTGTFRPYFDTTISGAASLKNSPGYNVEESIDTTSKTTLVLGNSSKKYTGGIKMYSTSGGNTLYGNTSNNSGIYVNYLPQKSGILALEQETVTNELVTGKEIVKKNGNVVTLIFNQLTLSEYVAIPSEFLPKEAISFNGLVVSDPKITKHSVDGGTEKYVYVYTPPLSFGTYTVDSTGLKEVRWLESEAEAEELAKANYGSTSGVTIQANFSKQTNKVINGTVTYVI